MKQTQIQLHVCKHNGKHHVVFHNGDVLELSRSFRSFEDADRAARKYAREVNAEVPDLVVVDYSLLDEEDE